MDRILNHQTYQSALKQSMQTEAYRTNNAPFTFCKTIQEVMTPETEHIQPAMDHPVYKVDKKEWRLR